MPAATLTWIAFLAFNLPVLAIMVAVPFGQRLDQALAEKSALGDSTGVASYSRITGALGAVILTSFFWAIGNIVLSYALDSRGIPNIAPLLSACGHFFLIGSALFLPYAFNQLKALFPWNGNLTAAARMIGASPQPILENAFPASRITVVNLSKKLSDNEVRKVLNAIQVQVTEHFTQEWNNNALLELVPSAAAERNVVVDGITTPTVYLGDSVDDSHTGAENIKGFHDQNAQSQPYGFVYLDVCKKYGEDWSITLSHEILEMLVDPDAVMRVDDPRTAHHGDSYALEVCDPTQADSYLIGNVRVCNFVTRRFFGLHGKLKGMNYLDLPQVQFMPRPKGYTQLFDRHGYSQQIWGEESTENIKAARALLGVYRRNGRRVERVVS
jgi:hypothetical protein